jgi:hypothetical protein
MPIFIRITELAVIAITFLTRIRELLSSNLGRDSGYPDWGISWFSSVSLGKFRYSTAIRPWPIYSKLFPNYHSFIICIPGATQTKYWKRPQMAHKHTNKSISVDENLLLRNQIDGIPVLLSVFFFFSQHRWHCTRFITINKFQLLCKL